MLFCFLAEAVSSLSVFLFFVSLTTGAVEDAIGAELGGDGFGFFGGRPRFRFGGCSASEGGAAAAAAALGTVQGLLSREDNSASMAFFFLLFGEFSGMWFSIIVRQVLALFMRRPFSLVLPEFLRQLYSRATKSAHLKQSRFLAVKA